MKPKPFLHLAPERSLVMTYALRQALEILQMPQLELSKWLLSEIEKNPLLELDPKHSKKSFFHETPALPTLYEHLTEQIREHFSDPVQAQSAYHLLDQLDEKGFLPPEIPNSEVLEILQTFDPPGLFARSLQESFLIQLNLKGKTKSHAVQLVRHSYDDLLQGRFSVIKKKLKVQDLKEAIKELSHLTLRPAHLFQNEPTQLITPDLKIEKIEKGWTLELIEEDLPKFHIKEEYLDLECENTEEIEALRTYKTEAKWIIRSMRRRRKILQDIGRILLKKQARFLDRKGPLIPLTMKELAEKLLIHESTLSRALYGKYVATPRGILPVKSLITTSTIQMDAKEILRSLIAKEDKKTPFTDDQLASLLLRQGIKIARRTIAKYRTILKIGPASRRKNH